MATTYGVLPTGFRRMPQEVILARIEADQLATISGDWDVSPESPVGQVNASMARQFSLLWEIAETTYNSNDPDKTEGALLVALAKLTGTQQQAAQYSKVTATVDLDAGTLLEAGTHFAEDADHAGSRWTPVEDFTADADGSHDVIFRAENTGPVTLGGSRLTVIATPVVGWNSITNGSVATLGSDIEQDPALRISRERQIANSAGATVAGIAAALSKLLEDKGVTNGNVLPFENPNPSSDANGLPPNSFEMVVFDGSSGGTAVLANDIAATIWKKKGSGARPYGTTSGTTTDANGDTVTVAFSRSTVRNVYIEYDLDVTPDFNASAFKLAVATAANAFFTGGKDILATKLIAIAWQQPNVDNVTAVRLGFAASPTLAADLVIGIREIGRFDDTGRIATF